METTSIISHQFKTPLAAIKSATEVILSGDLGTLTPEQRDYLNVVGENTETMIGLVKDLMDVSRIDQNRVEVRPEWVLLQKIVEGIIQDFRILAMARNSSIEYSYEHDIPPLFVDPKLIRDVISNIIFNAILYKHGKGAVKITVRREGQKGVLFTCQDDGIGVPESERERIFTKFYRSREAVEIEPHGSGLGLYISKGIVEKSGGKIGFSSVHGKGSAFYVFLPVTKDVFSQKT